MSKSETPRTDAIHSEKDKEFRDNLTQYRFMHDHAETLEKELTAVTEQRDRLAEALKSVASGAVYEARCIEIAREALAAVKGETK
jgi:hypothetical protein